MDVLLLVECFSRHVHTSLQSKTKLISYFTFVIKLVEVEDTMYALYYRWLVHSKQKVALSGVARDTPGSVSLETDANFPFATTTKHPLRPGSLWGEVQRPYPTGAWWLNLAIGEGDYPVAPLPYTMVSTDEGVGVSYSAMRRVETVNRVQDAYAADLTVSAMEGLNGRHIAK